VDTCVNEASAVHSMPPTVTGLACTLQATTSAAGGYNAQARWWNDETHAATVLRSERLSFDAAAESRLAPRYLVGGGARRSYQPQDRGA